MRRIHRSFGDIQVDRAVLWQAMLGKVHFGNDLYPRGDCGQQGAIKVSDTNECAVDPIEYLCILLTRPDMNIRCPQLYRIVQHVCNQPHDGLFLCLPFGSALFR